MCNPYDQITTDDPIPIINPIKSVLSNIVIYNIFEIILFIYEQYVYTVAMQCDYYCAESGFKYSYIFFYNISIFNITFSYVFNPISIII